MTQTAFSADWMQKFTDPYAVLGLPVTADERRVQKRYRMVASALHPDRHINSDPAARDTATQLLARLINPAYQRINQEKGRSENLALLRLKARQAFRDGKVTPVGADALKLMKLDVAEIDVFYEQAVTKLAEEQCVAIAQFAPITEQLTELNLVYLWRKQIPITPRPGPVPVPIPVEKPPEPEEEKNYADKHYQRAKEYARKGALNMAVRELQDAIRIDPNSSEYYATLGWIYWLQDLPGMARVYVKQALKLDPQNPDAREYARRIHLNETPTKQPAKPVAPAKPVKGSGGGLLGIFARRK